MVWLAKLCWLHLCVATRQRKIEVLMYAKDTHTYTQVVMSSKLIRAASTMEKKKKKERKRQIGWTFHEGKRYSKQTLFGCWLVCLSGWELTNGDQWVVVWWWWEIIWGRGHLLHKLSLLLSIRSRCTATITTSSRVFWFHMWSLLSSILHFSVILHSRILIIKHVENEKPGWSISAQGSL